MQRLVAEVKKATASVIADGHATLTEEFAEGPGDFLTLRPTNPNACEVEIILDGYPTVAYGEATDEMFGDENERIECLLADIADVIAGRFAWGYRQEKALRGTVTIQYGEFLGRRSFTRGGSEPDGLVEHHAFEPYWLHPR
jgi:hypothetical protein